MKSNSYEYFTKKENIILNYYFFLQNYTRKKNNKYNNFFKCSMNNQTNNTITNIDAFYTTNSYKDKKIYVEIQEIENTYHLFHSNTIFVDTISAFYFKDKNNQILKRNLNNNGKNVSKWRRNIKLIDEDIKIQKYGKIFSLPDNSILLYHFIDKNVKQSSNNNFFDHITLEEKMSFFIFQIFNINISNSNNITDDFFNILKEKFDEKQFKIMINEFRYIDSIYKKNNKYSFEYIKLLKLDFLFKKYLNISAFQKFLILDVKKLKEIFFSNNNNNNNNNIFSNIVNNKEKQKLFRYDTHESAYTFLKLEDLKRTQCLISDCIYDNNIYDLEIFTKKIYSSLEYNNIITSPHLSFQ